MMTRRELIAAATFTLLVGCRNRSAASPASTTAASTSTTSSTSTSTTAPTTTLAATAPPTTEPLPVPAAAPDPRAAEPRIELGSISIPRIDVDTSLFEGVSLTTLDIGPGHWPGSAMPGHRGNVVVAGHRTSHDRPFRHIDELAPGDPIVFTTPEGAFTYSVTGTEVVTPDQIRIIDQTDAYTATLFACHPVGSTRERIVVHLQLSA